MYMDLLSPGTTSAIVAGIKRSSAARRRQLLHEMDQRPLTNLGAKLGMYHELLSYITPGVKPFSLTQRVSLFYFQLMTQFFMSIFMYQHQRYVVPGCNILTDGLGKCVCWMSLTLVGQASPICLPRASWSLCGKLCNAFLRSHRHRPTSSFGSFHSRSSSS